MAKSDVLWLLIASLTLTYSDLRTGTAVVLLFKNNSITVAADSRTVGVDGKRRADNCKIAAVKSGMIFTFSGYDSGDSQLRQIALDIGAKSTNPTEAISALEKALDPKLRDMAAMMRRVDSSFFAKKIEGSAIYEGVFAKMENDGPRWAEEIFVPRVQPLGNIVIEARMNDCTSTCAGDFIGIGHHDGIDKFLTDHSVKSLSVEPITNVKKLIEIEIKEAPEAVGRPISILQLRQSGPVWINRGVCE
jgi:hypothetical protein